MHGEVSGLHPACQPYQTMKALKTPVYAALLIACCLVLTGFRKDSLTGRKIIDEYLSRHGLTSKIEKIKMVTLDSRGNVDTKEVLRLFLEDETHAQYSLLRFLNPENIRGVALLSKQREEEEYEQVLYMPALEQLRKISGSGQKGYFMGSDFAYEDLLPENPERYEYKRGLNDYLEGAECYTITAKPVDDSIGSNTGYAKRDIWISQEDYTILKIDFFTTENQLLKTLRFTQFKMVVGKEGATLASRAEMTHHLKDTTSMIAVTRGIYQKADIKHFFNEESLRNWKTEYDEQIRDILDQSN